MLDTIFKQLLQPLLTEWSIFKQVLVAILTLILGLALLLRGRKLYWFFIGMVGFFLGVYLGFRFVTAGGWLHWLLILGMGLLFAGLARIAQKIMVVIAAAIVLAGIGYMLPPASWPIITRYLAGAIFALLGALLALKLFNWGLIIGSAVLGAWLIDGSLPIVANVLKQPQLSINTLPILAGLVLIGIVIQAFGLPRKSRL
ncbi:MAG: hypothetical protein ACYC6L_05690 [Anaerolineae bacterium]